MQPCCQGECADGDPASPEVKDSCDDWDESVAVACESDPYSISEFAFEEVHVEEVASTSPCPPSVDVVEDEIQALLGCLASRQ